MFDRELRLTILGNAGVGKTTLIKRLKGEELETEKTTDISVEKRKIKLHSQQTASKLSLEKYRWYEIVAVDTPGDFTLRRQWRVAMAKYKADGILFLLDPTQSILVQKSAMEDAFNYYLDSLDMKQQKANRIARDKKALFFFVVNKIDLLGNSKEKAKDFLESFSETLKAYYEKFPKSIFKNGYISVQNSPYEKLDEIFEEVKKALYES